MRIEIVSNLVVHRAYHLAEIANGNAIRHIIETEDKEFLIEWTRIHVNTVDMNGAQLHLWSDEGHDVKVFDRETVEELIGELEK